MKKLIKLIKSIIVLSIVPILLIIILINNKLNKSNNIKKSKNEHIVMKIYNQPYSITSNFIPAHWDVTTNKERIAIVTIKGEYWIDYTNHLEKIKIATDKYNSASIKDRKILKLGNKLIDLEMGELNFHRKGKTTYFNCSKKPYIVTNYKVGDKIYLKD
jgi:hypothetical protein